MTAAAAPDARELGRLRWRCRRGLRELDVLLTRYLDEEFCKASAVDQNAFRRLLDLEDALIFAYCLGQQAPPTAELSVLIERMTARMACDR